MKSTRYVDIWWYLDIFGNGVYQGRTTLFWPFFMGKMMMNHQFSRVQTHFILSHLLTLPTRDRLSLSQLAAVGSVLRVHPNHHTPVDLKWVKMSYPNGLKKPKPLFVVLKKHMVSWKDLSHPPLLSMQNMQVATKCTAGQQRKWMELRIWARNAVHLSPQAVSQWTPLPRSPGWMTDPALANSPLARSDMLQKYQPKGQKGLGQNHQN